MHRSTALASLLLLTAAAPPMATVAVDVEGLRNHRGLIQLCLTRSPKHFPDCTGDPAAFRRSVSAADPHVVFSGVVPGVYAVTLVHDENANQKLDTALGIPREGFGFSRNPKIHFGPPKFDKVGIDVPGGITRTTIRVQYML